MINIIVVQPRYFNGEQPDLVKDLLEMMNLFLQDSVQRRFGKYYEEK